MKRHYFKDFFHSFYSMKSYKDFSNQRSWKTTGFIFLTSLILTLIFSGIVYVKASHYASTFSDDFLQEMKDFSFKNGTFSVEEDAFDHMPLIYPFGESKAMIVVDTRDKYDDTMLKNNETVIYVAKKKLLVKFGGSDVQTLSYKEFKDVSFTKSDVSSLVKKAPKVITLLSLCSFFFVVIAYYIYALLVSIFALISNHFLKTSLSYKQLFNVSVYALTPMFFVEHLMILPSSIGTYLLYPVSCIYIYFALKKIKNL